MGDSPNDERSDPSPPSLSFVTAEESPVATISPRLSLPPATPLQKSGERLDDSSEGWPNPIMLTIPDRASILPPPPPSATLSQSSVGTRELPGAAPNEDRRELPMSWLVPPEHVDTGLVDVEHGDVAVGNVDKGSSETPPFASLETSAPPPGLSGQPTLDPIEMPQSAVSLLPLSLHSSSPRNLEVEDPVQKDDDPNHEIDPPPQSPFAPPSVSPSRQPSPTSSNTETIIASDGNGHHETAVPLLAHRFTFAFVHEITLHGPPGEAAPSVDPPSTQLIPVELDPQSRFTASNPQEGSGSPEQFGSELFGDEGKTSIYASKRAIYCRFQHPQPQTLLFQDPQFRISMCCLIHNLRTFPWVPREMLIIQSHPMEKPSPISAEVVYFVYLFKRRTNPHKQQVSINNDFAPLGFPSRSGSPLIALYPQGDARVGDPFSDVAEASYPPIRMQDSSPSGSPLTHGFVGSNIPTHPQPLYTNSDGQENFGQPEEFGRGAGSKVYYP